MINVTLVKSNKARANPQLIDDLGYFALKPPESGDLPAYHM